MIEITSLEDIEALRESIDIECKLAGGREGKGALPNDMWETYSAFANTLGGDILLGLKEQKDGYFELRGIEKPQKVLDDLWSTIDNKQKASVNLLREKQEPSEQTLLELHTLSLVPEETIHELRAQLGEKTFNELTDIERTIMVTAQIENTVDHARLMEILAVHPRDLSATLSGLVSRKLLWQEGSGRGTVYFTAEARMEDAYKEMTASNDGLVPSSGGTEVSSGGKDQSSGGKAVLEAIAEPIARVQRASRADVEAVILKLCSVKPLKQDELGALLNRNGDFLRKDYLQALTKSKKLRLLYPTKPQHPNQAYITEGEKA